MIFFLMMLFCHAMAQTPSPIINRTLCPGNVSLTLRNNSGNESLVSVIREQGFTFDIFLENDTFLNDTEVEGWSNMEHSVVMDYFVPPFLSAWTKTDADFIALKDTFHIFTNVTHMGRHTQILVHIDPIPRLRLESNTDELMIRIPTDQLLCSPSLTPNIVSHKLLIVIVNDEPLGISTAANIRVAAFMFCITAGSVSCAILTQSSVLNSMVKCNNYILRMSHLKARWIISPFLYVTSGKLSTSDSAVLFSVILVGLSFGAHSLLVRVLSKRWGTDARAALFFPNASVFIALLAYPGIVTFVCRTVFEEPIIFGLGAVVLYCVGGLPVVLYCYHRGKAAFPMQWFPFFEKEPPWYQGYPAGTWTPVSTYQRYSVMFDDFRDPYAHYLCVINLFISLIAGATAVETNSKNACRLSYILSCAIHCGLLYIFMRNRPFRAVITSLFACCTLALLTTQIALQMECLNHTDNPLHWCDSVTNRVAAGSAVIQLMWGIHGTVVMAYTMKRLWRPTPNDKVVFRKQEMALRGEGLNAPSELSLVTAAVMFKLRGMTATATTVVVVEPEVPVVVVPPPAPVLSLVEPPQVPEPPNFQKILFVRGHKGDPLWLQRAKYMPSKPINPLAMEPKLEPLVAERLLWQRELSVSRESSESEYEDDTVEINDGDVVPPGDKSRKINKSSGVLPPIPAMFLPKRKGYIPPPPVGFVPASQKKAPTPWMVEKL